MSGICASVLVVDDDFYARDALQALLARDRRTRVWGEAEDVARALELIDKAEVPPPDVVLLDARLREDDWAGVNGIPRLKTASPRSRVLMTSVMRRQDVVLAAIHKGADGYVWKNESGESIANAVVGVAEGRFVVTKSIGELLLDRASELGRYAAEVLPDEDAFHDLTQSIRSTVHLYCFCGMSAKEIADELQVSVHTVNSRIKAAYQILQADNRQDAFQKLVAGWAV